MLELTREIKNKYFYVCRLFYLESDSLFTFYSLNELIFDELSFYDHIFEVNFCGLTMCSDIWRKYLQKQHRIIHRFEKIRYELKKQAYSDLLRAYFCNDIVGCIIEFIL